LRNWSWIIGNLKTKWGRVIIGYLEAFGVKNLDFIFIQNCLFTDEAEYGNIENFKATRYNGKYERKCKRKWGKCMEINKQEGIEIEPHFLPSLKRDEYKVLMDFNKFTKKKKKSRISIKILYYALSKLWNGIITEKWKIW